MVARVTWADEEMFDSYGFDQRVLMLKVWIIAPKEKERRMTMPKGKKFDAAEKHFYEKEQKLRQRIKFLDGVINQMNEEWDKLQKENKQLKLNNEKLAEANSQLMKIQNLSEEDVQELLAHTKHLNKVYETMEAMNEYTTIY